MSIWADISKVADSLSDALTAFDWERADALVEQLIVRLRADFAHGFPEDQAKRMLAELRRKRRFRTMGRLAETLILAGVRLPRVRRQFAQALIDQDHFAASEFLLQSILDEVPGSATEKDEAKGLLGRIYKQWHLSPGSELAKSGPAYLVKSFEIYSQAFDADARNFWHGINACALAARARRYGIALPGDPNPHTLAGRVLDSLKEDEDEHPNGVYAFAIATAVEAYLALGRLDDALAKLGEYIRCKDADAFELASTLRNLVQVWELTVDMDPGATLLPVLRAALLRQEGGEVSMETAQKELDAVRKITEDPGRFQAVLGDTGYKLVGWYERGLKRCEAVARIETKSGSGFGTGWLVRGEDFSPKWAGRILLLTNKHVLSPLVNGQRWDIPQAGKQAKVPEEGVANFQLQKAKCDIGDAVWTSPDEKLDATFVTLKSLPPKVVPLDLDPAVVKMKAPPARVYVIGHPKGGDLAISLQDNRMVDCDGLLVQYRAPTEVGSSGSPVFEDTDWNVIALHHTGSKFAKKLTGAGMHAANEGILIQALRQAIAADPSVQ